MHLSLDSVQIETFPYSNAGATGYVGSLVLENLLRTTDVHKVFVMCREQGTLTAQQRIDKLLQTDLFHLISKDRKAAVQVRQVPLSCCNPSKCFQTWMSLTLSSATLLLWQLHVVKRAERLASCFLRVWSCYAVLCLILLTAIIACRQ